VEKTRGHIPHQQAMVIRRSHASRCGG
jgi:hypothetical protein